MKTATHFVSLSETPFSRRGSYFAFYNDIEGLELFGQPVLYIGSTRGGGSMMSTSMNYRQVKVEIVKDGKVLPSVISTTNYEVLLQCDYGTFSLCIGERRFIRIKGTDGLCLRLTPRVSFFGGMVTDLHDGTWQFDFHETLALLLPFAGKLNATRGPGSLVFDITPDSKGIVDVGIEEHTIDPIRREFEQYPSYEACVESYKTEFDAFAQAVCPSLPEEYEPLRKKAIWTTWCLMVEPDGEAIFKHSMVKMLRGMFEHVSGWQQAMQIISLSHNVRLAWDILSGVFDYQDKNGKIADLLDNSTWNKNAMKPPFQGVALRWLLDNCALEDISYEDKLHVYQGITRWTDYFFKCRDIDKDGIWENRNPGETGWEDAPYFTVGFPLASPDMNAYLALQLEAQAKLGRLIGIDDEICVGFENRAKVLVQKIIDAFWDGSRWVAFNSETKAVAYTKSLPLFAVLILGKRLPQDIIDKSINYIFKEGEFLTPFGLASESLKSDDFLHGWSKGCVNTPSQFIFCLALEACGRTDLAKDVAKRYLNTLKETGLYHMHNALSGQAEKLLVGHMTNGEKYLFWSSWTSSCYLFLANRY